MSDLDRARLARHAILEFLALRQALFFEAETILERVQRSRMLDFRPEVDEVVAALTFLEGLKLIERKHDKLGGRGIYYQATSAGVLAFEKGTIGEP